MKYKVRVSELHYGAVTVEAASEEEAKTIAASKEINYFDKEITDMTAEPVDDDRTYIVTELCPHCQSEIEMRWNTDMQGYKAFCPVCGKRLMLCDECRHSENGYGCDYDSGSDTCKHNKSDTATLEVETPIGTIAVGRTVFRDYQGVQVELRHARERGTLLASTGYDSVCERLVTHVYQNGMDDTDMRVTEHRNVVFNK